MARQEYYTVLNAQKQAAGEEMSAIILEGRDESGKTTLAQDLSYRTGAQVLKSPAGKDEKWAPRWGNWAHDHANSRRLFILDRTPEISELVYGTARGNVRTSLSFLRAWSQWRHHRIFLVFCWTRLETINGVHYDATGNLIDYRWLSDVEMGYQLLYHILLREQSNSLRVVSYDWKQENALAELITEFADWRMMSE